MQHHPPDVSIVSQRDFHYDDSLSYWMHCHLSQLMNQQDLTLIVLLSNLSHQGTAIIGMRQNVSIV